MFRDHINPPAVFGNLNRSHFAFLQRSGDGPSHVHRDGDGAGAVVHALHRRDDVRLLRQEDRVGPRQEARSHQVTTLLGGLSFARFCQQEFGEFPRLVGHFCSYLLPKQAGGTPQILVYKT